MFSVHHLYHPFLNDPGTSQGQRLPAVLAADSPPVDGRQTSDILNYFAAIAHQINFYDANLNVSDWGPFFSGDLPFLLSSMAAYDGDAVNTQLAAYTRMFVKNPSQQGLQLLLLYTWYTAIYPVQQWASEIQGTGIPLEQTLQTLIKDRLPGPVKIFISSMNTAVKCFCVSPVDTSVLLQNSAWGLTEADLTAYDVNFPCNLKSQRSQLLALQSSLSGLINYFTEVLSLAASGAAIQVNNPTNLYNLLQISGQQDVRPHLALMYAFLSQFANVQNDLNNLTEGHLDFFFQNVLQLAPGNMNPDSAYIVFTLQKQVPSYPLPAGLSLKDGKDSKNADILFALDAPAVITQAQATNFMTVFVNTPSSGGVSYVEGVYMAPDATKADGLTQAFPNPATASWPTFGSKVSEYTPPKATAPADYPLARLGFILTSKVLLLNEGVRRVHIQLACQWQSVCTWDTITSLFAQDVSKALGHRYGIITQALIDQAVSQGLSSTTALALAQHYLTDPCSKPLCDGDTPAPLAYHITRIPMHGPVEAGMSAWETKVWDNVVQPQGIFSLVFSGAKAWLMPDDTRIDMEIIDPINGYFLLHFHAKIGQEQPAVTFYNSGALGEDFGTTDPLVKVQLNDTIKMKLGAFLATGSGEFAVSVDDCGLTRQPDTCGAMVSFYEFFRNVVVLRQLPGSGGPPHDQRTKIHVTVCGVQNLVVQNDDGLLNAKKPFTPFGAKPVVPDFDVFHHFPGPGANLIGPNFYVGSAEVFLKKWERINVNLNWKGRPSHMHKYYLAYMQHSNWWTRTHFPRHQVNLAVLHNNVWKQEHNPGFSVNPYSRLNFITNDYNRHFFAKEHRIGICDSEPSYKYSFDIRPKDFRLTERDLSYDPTFAPLASFVSGTTLNGFLRITMENQDFLHKLYSTVMAEQIILRSTTNPFAPLPNEPWTPTMLNISLDYEAIADVEDIQLIQLYPFQGTYQSVEITGQPPLLATFCDQGNLFIGLTGLNPGDSLNMLFQLAEATGDTEQEAGTVSWQYLAANQWQALRPGFEIVSDTTNGLSTTGVIQFSFPDDISDDNTIMPASLYWIMASVAGNSAAVSQIMAIVTQAALATFAPTYLNNQPVNDLTRPATPLPAGSISKLTVPNSSVTGVNQPYDSFGGDAPENTGTDYVLRVSEQLRHRGRAVQKWDYERMVLQQFPQLLGVKCINHSFALNSQTYKWDFPMAPGNIILAVLPDPTQLTTSNSLQPTVPTSMLNAIAAFLAGSTSPFVRLFVKNPRYEPVDICVSVTLQAGMNATFCQSQLQQDIQGFMAPWETGDVSAFQFAQRLYRSDLVEFIESRSYIDSLLRLQMCHEGDPMPVTPAEYIEPLTPRSILVAGKVVVNTGNGGGMTSGTISGMTSRAAMKVTLNPAGHGKHH
jgi:hypothetical protein